MAIPAEHLPQARCEGCPFNGPKCGSKGDPLSNLVIVGESPGIREVLSKVPFSGPSGEILHRLIPEGRAYVLNAMECNPPPKKKDERTLNQGAMVCHDRLVSKIQLAPRRLILALGNPAVRSLTRNYGLKITQIRGSLIPSHLSELGILPAIHPAALMRGTGSYRQFKDDLTYALALANGADPKTFRKPIYIWVKSARELIDRLRYWLLHTNDLTCDVETQGFSRRKHKLISIGIAQDTLPDEPVLCFTPDLLPVVKRYFESPHISWGWHNGKFDVQFFWEAGIKARVDHDTLLMSYALDETRGIHGLEAVSQEILNCPDYKFVIKPYKDQQKKTIKRKNKNKELHTDLSPHWFMWQKDPEGLMEYMAVDTGNTAKIRTIYRERVAKDKALEKLYTKTLIPASQMIAEVESNGIYVDQEWLNDIDEVVAQDVDERRQRVVDISGDSSLNPNSPQQMARIIYDVLKFPNKYERSTSKEVLKKFSESASTRHPIIKALSDYRKSAKIYSTYIVGLRPHIHDDSRVYASYLIHGTITGRLASRNPNMQNIPRDWLIRGIFAAKPGYCLLEVDLSQAELRSLAALSGDKAMVALYREGRDIHTELAKALYPGWEERHAFPIGTPEYTQAKEERTKCKNVNFGIVYGITEFGLQDQIGGTLDECRKMIQGWGEKFPEAWAFIEMCRNAPRNGKTIVTLFGRKKRVGIVTNDNIGFLENEAANFPHQSIASDITLHAAMRKKDHLRALDISIVNLVHDAIIMEVPVTPNNVLAHHAAMLVGRELAQVPMDWGIRKVPFLASAALGDRWGSLEEQETWNHELAQAA